MAQGRPPSFQFYPADYLADFDCRQLTFDQRGRYLDLLCLSWLSETPGLMSEDDARKMLSYSTGEWGEMRKSFIGHVLKEVNGNLVQKRMAKERQGQITRYEQAKRGAEVTNARRYGLAMRSVSDRCAVAPSSTSSNIGRGLDSKAKKESEPAFSQKARVNDLVKDLSTHLNGKAP